MMRIALGGIAYEGCTFSPLPVALTEFDVLRGAALRARYPFLPALPEVEAEPLVWARGLPGGIVEAVAYAELKGELIAGLRTQGPWDGVYLDLHGALFVAGLEDAEYDLVRAVRTAVGPACMIAASYDLHGNLSQAVMDQVDIVTAYRTAPHEDEAETRERAVRLLVDSLKTGRRPAKAFVSIPLMLPGERAMTTVEPGASLYREVAALARRRGIVDASLLIGFAWADEPRVGASVVVLGDDHATASWAAQDLAAAVWTARRDFAFGMPTGDIDECIDLALAAPEPTVFISDAGDNPTGGAVGDVPAVLERLVARRVQGALFASLADEAAVARCFAAGVGSEVTLSLGGKLDTRHGSPFPLTGRVVSLHDGPNRHAVLQVNGVTAIVTARRTAFTTLAQFAACNLNPLDFKIVVVKLGYLFPELRRIAPLALLTFSPGAVNPDLTQLSYTSVRRPIYPLDDDMEFCPHGV